MIPLNDTQPNRYSRLSYITVALILANVAVYVIEILFMFDDPLTSFRLYGSVPQLILKGQGAGALTPITSLFLHGDFLHLFSNMLALWVFGGRVEDACGHLRFLIFYLVCGVGADLLSVLINPNGNLASIGASGAVFGVMGAYLILYPKGRIRTLVLTFGIPIAPRIRAYWIILYMLVIEIIPALRVVLQGAQYRIGHWAHLGGFIASLSIFLFLRPEAYARYRHDLPV